MKRFLGKASALSLSHPSTCPCHACICVHAGLAQSVEAVWCMLFSDNSPDLWVMWHKPTIYYHSVSPPLQYHLPRQYHGYLIAIPSCILTTIMRPHSPMPRPLAPPTLPLRARYTPSHLLCGHSTVGLATSVSAAISLFRLHLILPSPHPHLHPP